MTLEGEGREREREMDEKRRKRIKHAYISKGNIYLNE